MTVVSGESIADEVRKAVADYGRLSVPIAQVANDDDLYAAGMTSHATVAMMFALEEAFGLEFPEHLLRQSTFQSVNAITEALSSLVEDKRAAELGQR